MAGLLISGRPEASQGRHDPVAAELRRWASSSFTWGETDCGLSILAYAERVRGRRLSPWPRYATALGAARMLRAAGGYPAYFVWAMGRIGCPVTDQPRRGDVGLVELSTGLTACLCLGGLWAARGHDGVVMVPGTALVACEVICPQQ